MIRILVIFGAAIVAAMYIGWIYWFSFVCKIPPYKDL